MTYETQDRLHVHIYDTEQSQFQIPTSVFPLPTQIQTSNQTHSNLAFEYSKDNSFQFWIKRNDGSQEIVFDTRSYPLIFEKQVYYWFILLNIYPYSFLFSLEN